MCYWKIGRSSGRSQDVRFLQKIDRNRWRTNRIPVEYFPGFTSLQIQQEIQNICKSGTLNLRNLLTGSPPCQCSTTLFGEEKQSDSEKSRHTRRNSCRDTGRSSVLEMTRGCMVKQNTFLKKSLIQSQVVQRLEETGHPGCTSASALSRGILRMLKGKETITEQFRMGVNITVWQRKERNKKDLGRKESVSNGVLSSLFLKKLFLLGIFPKTCICLRKHTQDFESLSETKSVHKVMRRCNFSASGRIWYELEKSDLTRTTVLDSWFHWAGKVRFSRVIHQPRVLAAIPGGTVIEVQIVKFLTNMDLKLPFHA